MQATLSRKNYRLPQPFALGEIRVTESARSIGDDDLRAALCAHSKAHWGYLDDETWDFQDELLCRRGCVRSAWFTSGGQAFFVSTCLLRQVTTVATSSDFE